MRSRLVLAGAVFGFLGVALGAFGAHALSARLSPDALGTFETAVRYQLIHAVALMALAGIVDWDAKMVGRSGTLFVAGIVIFAGSLYANVFTGIGLFGAITPFGGLCFLAGWAVLAWGAWGSSEDDASA
jgi:uncharacterized membrane protein YgdD (TMEM256/DUF423 family)